ncbi:MAG: TlpA disulfide reductase family protein [Armatimonadaceae bacterium]
MTRFRMVTAFAALTACALIGMPALVQAQQDGKPAPQRPERKPLLAPGTPAPDFTAIKYGSNTELKLSDYKGKVVILDFWATWCPPCKASMPHLEQVWQQVKDQDVVVLAVCVSDAREAYEKWVPEHKDKYTFQFAFDPAGRDRSKPNISGGLFNVTGIPTTYIIGKDGKVVEGIVGFSGAKDTRIEMALQKIGVKVAAGHAAE